MPANPISSFEEFQALSSSGKREFIQNNLTLKHIQTGPLGGEYLQKLTLNTDKWQPLSTRTKFAIMQYIYNSEEFDLSGGYCDVFPYYYDIVKSCQSGIFFGKVVMNDVIGEILRSGDIRLIGNFLYAMAENDRVTNAIPPRENLLQANDREILINMLNYSMLKFDKDISVIDTAANYINVDFILMLLELRQDLKFTPTGFEKTITDAFKLISDNAEAGDAEILASLKKIKTWLEENKKLSTEERLLLQITPLMEQQPLLNESPESDEGEHRKRLKPSYTA